MLPGGEGDRRRSPRSAASRRASTASARRRTPRSATSTSLLDFVERIADATGLPVGIKSAVGEQRVLGRARAARWRATGGGPDFITIDGGEGGTGAAPLVFTDHVALPFKLGFTRVYAHVRERRHRRGRRVHRLRQARASPTRRCSRFALGCDMVNVGREAMLAIGCIQAQRCHTGHCPTGVATQNRWLMRGLDPDLKPARAANYIVALRDELLSLARACGVAPPRPHRPRPARGRLHARTTPRRCASSSATKPSGRS